MCGRFEGMWSTSPAATSTTSDSSSPSQNRSVALEDVGQLLVLVRVLRDDASLLEVHVRQHHPLGRDEPPCEVRLRAAPSACRPSGSALPLVARSAGATPSRSMPSSICASSTRLKESRTLSRAAAVGEERACPGTIADARLGRAAREVDRVDAAGSVSQEKNPPCGPRPARRLRHRALERREQPLALARGRARATARAARRSSRGGAYSSKSRCPSAPAHWSVFCFAATSCATTSAGPGRPAEAHAGEERLRRRARLDDDVRREAPEARQRVAVEAELAVGDVLDDQEAVAARELDERRAPLGREADAGRVLVVGDRVERASAAGRAASRRSSSSTSRPSLVHRDATSVGLEAAEGHGSRRGRSAPRRRRGRPGRGTTCRGARAPRSRRS